MDRLAKRAAKVSKKKVDASADGHQEGRRRGGRVTS